jgi:hypothetical protein
MNTRRGLGLAVLLLSFCSTGVSQAIPHQDSVTDFSPPRAESLARASLLFLVPRAPLLEVVHRNGLIPQYQYTLTKSDKKPDHTHEGILIGGTALGLAGAYTGFRWCSGDGSRSGAECFGRGLAFGALSAVVGASLGGMIGSFFPKDQPPPEPK